MNRTRAPKNVLITHVYSSDNKGDAALTSVLLQDIRRVFPAADRHILQLEATAADSLFEGVSQSSGFMHFALEKYRHPLAKLVYTAYMLPMTLLWAGWFRLTGRQFPLPADLGQVARHYAKADLVVAVGGGYIRSRAGLMNRMNIPLLLHPLFFAWLLGKPTMLYAQSVGPFVHEYERPLVAWVLRRMACIMLREDISMELLRNAGVAKNVLRTIDSGFLLEAKGVVDVRKQYKVPKGALLVGVTVRSWLSGDAQVAYERAVAAALDSMVESQGAHVLFVPQVTAAKGDDDREVSRRVQGMMHHAASATVITDEPDHHRIKAIYDQLDLLLGTRFHSVIFSLTSFVPVLAIEYEHKTSGIMRDLNLEDWVIPIENATTDRLVKQLHRLARERVAYRKHLREHLPPYVQRARQTALHMAKRYRAITQ